MGSYSVVGLGKLGASMAAAIASRGHVVIGVDVVRAAVDAINEGRAPVRETGLDDLIRANRERLRATTSVVEAIENSDVTFVVVPTPSDDRGAFSITFALEAFGAIGRALAIKRTYHLVVLTSTVLPGATTFGLLPVLERESGKACGLDFGLCYSPEFIALGSVIRDFLNPDLTLIGEHDARSGDTLEQAYAGIIANGAHAARMSIENAELAKIALNSYVTMKISFANTLRDLCERIPGGDVDAVTDAIGLDSRIGRKYMTGALGFGGPCFPRDNKAFAFLARALDSRSPLAEATDEVNRSTVPDLVARVRALLGPSGVAAVLGLAYKPESHVTEESQGLALAKALSEAGSQVVAYDPLAPTTQWSRSLEHCLSAADVLVIATPDPRFRRLGRDDFANSRPGAIVLDCWRLLDARAVTDAGLEYIATGRGVTQEIVTRRLADLWTS